MRVQERRVVADGVVAIELRAVDGYELTPFAAGSHIDVELPVRDAHGHFIVRQYSLCNDPAEHDRYVIGVGRDANTRGGSAYLHDNLQVGDVVHISTPRNHFQLYEPAPSSVLVAGGIGVTPMLAMARRLSALGQRWTLYYCARTPERAAFLDELKALPGHVIPVFDGVPGGTPIDLSKVMADAPTDAHLYCCGPTTLMEAFERAAATRDPSTVHVEWFKPRPVVASATAGVKGDGNFVVKLANSGVTLTIPPQKSILDVLIEAGIAVQHSCCDGVCGTCETRVLEGIPDHRDSVLLGEEANATDRIMVCVSRCAGASLTLDL
ncbi:PDR/VanB family oxidoreductase [Variovorax sp. J22R115]|uniref:PDR/VanB family oxidoreductase n=1 Tax=Variovorax sp. J22R115 TaxID=3053509 RepID=UPI0025765C96|nr:PDR/VanB family oxidoreductase [Variovorax sp. J22R115]MDM0050540.1 PDR/VanB family oxidoreductase [Variovorax sp. J22R115]